MEYKIIRGTEKEPFTSFTVNEGFIKVYFRPGGISTEESTRETSQAFKDGIATAALVGILAIVVLLLVLAVIRV